MGRERLSREENRQLRRARRNRRRVRRTSYWPSVLRGRDLARAAYLGKGGFLRRRKPQVDRGPSVVRARPRSRARVGAQKRRQGRLAPLARR
jgi:hypothetical protein